MFQESRVGAQQLDTGRAGPLDAGDQLIAEALDALLRVRRPLAQPDVQRLARVRARGEDRVIAEQLGVAVAGALLEVAVHLADEAVDVDHQSAVARAGAGQPRPLQRPAQQRVELAHMPERERAQERPQRRGRRQPAAQQSTSATRAQHARVVDAVGAEHHRKQQRHHLATRVGGARPVAAQPHQIARQRLDSQASRERRDEHHAGVRDDPLIVKNDTHAIRSDRPVILHHQADLLTQDAAARYSRFFPAQEVILCRRPDGPDLPTRCRVGGRRLDRAAM